MEGGIWRMKDERRRMEDEEKNIYIFFFMLKMHIYATHGEASEDGLLIVHGGQQDDIFLYDSYVLYLDNLFTKTK